MRVLRCEVDREESRGEPQGKAVGARQAPGQALPHRRLLDALDVPPPSGGGLPAWAELVIGNPTDELPVAARLFLVDVDPKQ